MPPTRGTQFHRQLAELDRPEIFISTRSADDIDADIAQATGPLAGILLAVKDNVDVAGLPTTAACPEYSYVPTDDAPAVAALTEAGAVVVGKTNLDQFATGLVGTRSPYGAVRDSRRLNYISGGSSSGSAVAVALGLVDIAIGTDTAGSGRVPAGVQGIVGIKPTIGVVPTDGVVPACASYDCVTIFAADLHTASAAMQFMAIGHRPWPALTKFAAPQRPKVAVPRELVECSPAVGKAFDEFTASIASTVDVVPIDMTDYLAAARLLYDGALVAERYDAVGAAVDRQHDGLDATVASIITGGQRFSAVDLLRDRQRVHTLKSRALELIADCDALIVPTAPWHPTIDEVNADPVTTNARMGTYTNFCNLFDMCGVAVPIGIDDDGGQFGVSIVAPAFNDAVALDIAVRLTHSYAPTWIPAPAVDLAVFGAHLRGQPLEWQLTTRGAQWLGPIQTASQYHLRALDTQPPKPGLIRVPSDGSHIRGELWRMSPAALGEFLAALPTPMMLGSVELDDGRWVVGFGCDYAAATSGRDITAQGGWVSAISSHA